MKNQRTFLATSIIACFCAQPLLAHSANNVTALDREAMKVFEESMSRIVIKCGASSYVKDNGDIYELGRLSVNVGISKLSAADIANGYEWMGYGSIYYAMARMYNREERTWEDWQMGLIIGAGGRELNRRKGKWTVEESNWEEQKHPISCNEIPK